MNKYRRWYKQLMARAKKRVLLGYFERHHVVPKSLGGTNQKQNIVRLTYREHFLAHWLLTKFTTGVDRRKMLFAFSKMTDKFTEKRIVSSWQYAVAIRAAREKAKLQWSDPVWCKKYKKRILKKAAAGCGTPESRKKNSERSKKLWKDPAYRLRVIAAQNAGKATKPKKPWTAKEKSKARERSIELWNDPVWSLKNIQAQHGSRDLVY